MLMRGLQKAAKTPSTITTKVYHYQTVLIQGPHLASAEPQPSWWDLISFYLDFYNMSLFLL